MPTTPENADRFTRFNQRAASANQPLDDNNRIKLEADPAHGNDVAVKTNASTVDVPQGHWILEAYAGEPGVVIDPSRHVVVEVDQHVPKDVFEKAIAEQKDKLSRRTRTGLAGAALLLALTGVGGFVAGRATAGFTGRTLLSMPADTLGAASQFGPVDGQGKPVSDTSNQSANWVRRGDTWILPRVPGQTYRNVNAGRHFAMVGQDTPDGADCTYRRGGIIPEAQMVIIFPDEANNLTLAELDRKARENNIAAPGEWCNFVVLPEPASGTSTPGSPSAIPPSVPAKK